MADFIRKPSSSLSQEVYPTEKDKIKAYAKEAIKELLEDEEFIKILKDKVEHLSQDNQK